MPDDASPATASARPPPRHLHRCAAALTELRAPGDHAHATDGAAVRHPRLPTARRRPAPSARPATCRSSTGRSSSTAAPSRAGAAGRWIGIDGGLNTTGTPEGLRADAGSSGSTFRSLRMAGWGAPRPATRCTCTARTTMVPWSRAAGSGWMPAAPAPPPPPAAPASRCRAARENRIGGTTAAQRNVISKSNTWASTCTGQQQQPPGHHIGTDATGTLAAGNYIGIANYAVSPSTIGGPGGGGGQPVCRQQLEPPAGRHQPGQRQPPATVQGNTFGLSATQAAITRPRRRRSWSPASPALASAAPARAKATPFANASGAGVAR